MLKLLRRGAIAGLLAGAAYAIWRTIASRAPDTGGMTFEAQPFPSPPRPIPASPAPEQVVSPPWVEPEDGVCPVSHPVKAKIASGIFHLPGGGSYDRTRPDRCYADAAAAESDGLRPAKR